jgi:hypothetical protein
VARGRDIIVVRRDRKEGRRVRHWSKLGIRDIGAREKRHWSNLGRKDFGGVREKHKEKIKNSWHTLLFSVVALIVCPGCVHVSKPE